MSTTAPSTTSPWVWLGAFGVFSFLMVMASESDSYGEIAVALSWLTAAGATVLWWNEFDTNLAALIGTPTSTTKAG